MTDASADPDSAFYGVDTHDVRLDVQSVSSDVTVCATYLGGDIQQVVVATARDDFRIMCPHLETRSACLEVASSWRVE